MKRRRRGGGDSLDLLLDTISNVFGGLMLMAILVVIQAQATTARLPARDAGRAERELEVRKLSFELDRLEARRAQLRSRRPSETPEEPEEGSARLAARHAELHAAIAAGEARLSALRAEEEAQRTGGEELRARVCVETERVRAAEQRVEALEQTRVGVLAESTRRQVRLPFRHAQRARTQRNIMIVGERVYGLPEDCLQTSRPNRGTLHRPRPGAGRALPDNDPGTRRVLELVRGRPPGSVFISFWVSRDEGSFRVFQRMRALLVAEGYEYSVWTFAEEEGLLLYPGSPEVE